MNDPGVRGGPSWGSRSGCPAAWRAREQHTCDSALLEDEGAPFCPAGSALGPHSLAPETRAPSGNASASPPVDHPPEEAHSPESLKKPEAGGTAASLDARDYISHKAMRPRQGFQLRRRNLRAVGKRLLP